MGSPLQDARGPCQGQCSGLQALPTAGEQGVHGALALALPTPRANSSSAGEKPQPSKPFIPHPGPQPPVLPCSGPPQTLPSSWRGENSKSLLRQ